jgi:hypothetical protein
MGVSQNSELDADFESVEKSCKEIFSNKFMRVKILKLCGFHLLVLSTKVIGNFLNSNFKGRWVES